MKKLHISEDLSLSLDFVTKTAAILAQRRKGKTYTASVLAEELIIAKVPVVILDPTGAWWGMRASSDGKSAGLPVVILGGQHGDLPLERGAGVFVADLVVDHPGHYVIDFSLFESAEAEREFATAFAVRIYRRKAHAGMNFPMHLIIDEADRFIPQRVPSGDQTMLGAFETIVRRGGLRGLGTTVISQRAAVVNKNVLEQIDILIVLRVVGPNDQAAIFEYVKAKGSTEELKELRESMASLELGEAWVWEPGSEPYLFKRIHVRKRTTFNSSATPEAGKATVEPKQLAAIDIETIKGKMQQTIERAKENDPKALKAEVSKLRQQLANLQLQSKPAPMVPAVPMVDEAAIVARIVAKVSSELEAPRKALTNLGLKIQQAAIAANVSHNEIDCALGLAREMVGFPIYSTKGWPKDVIALVNTGSRSAQVGVDVDHEGKVHVHAPPHATVVTNVTNVTKVTSNGDLSGPQVELLNRLAEFRAMSRQQVRYSWLAATLRTTIRSRGFEVNTQKLRREGYIESVPEESVRITEKGLSVVGEREPLTKNELQSNVFYMLSDPQGALLRLIIRTPGMSEEWLAQSMNTTVRARGFEVNMQTLRRNELIVRQRDGGWFPAEWLV